MITIIAFIKKIGETGNATGFFHGIITFSFPVLDYQKSQIGNPFFFITHN